MPNPIIETNLVPTKNATRRHGDSKPGTIRNPAKDAEFVEVIKAQKLLEHSKLGKDNDGETIDVATESTEKNAEYSSLAIEAQDLQPSPKEADHLDYSVETSSEPSDLIGASSEAIEPGKTAPTDAFLRAGNHDVSEAREDSFAGFGLGTEPSGTQTVLGSTGSNLRSDSFSSAVTLVESSRAEDISRMSPQADLSSAPATMPTSSARVEAEPELSAQTSAQSAAGVSQNSWPNGGVHRLISRDVFQSEKHEDAQLPEHDEVSANNPLNAKGNLSSKAQPLDLNILTKPDQAQGLLLEKRQASFELADTQAKQNSVEQRLTALSSTLNALDNAPVAQPPLAAPAQVLLQPISGLESVLQEDEALLDSVEAEFSSTSTRLNTSLTSSGTSLPRLDFPKHLAMQFQDTLRAMPDKPVEISLQPEELGRVRMSVSANETSVVLTVLAERTETVELLRRHAEQLSKELAHLGFGSVDLAFGQGEDTQTNSDDSTGTTAQHLSQQEAEDSGDSIVGTHLGLDHTRALDVRV